AWTEVLAEMDRNRGEASRAANPHVRSLLAKLYTAAVPQNLEHLFRRHREYLRCVYSSRRLSGPATGSPGPPRRAGRAPAARRAMPGAHPRAECGAAAALP